MIFIMETFKFYLKLYSAVSLFHFFFVMFELAQSFFKRKQKQKKNQVNQLEILRISRNSLFILPIQYQHREKAEDPIVLNGCAVFFS